MAVKTYKKGDTTQLTKNFNVSEFRCGIGSPCSCTTTLVDEQLPIYLQMIRDHFGARIIITSGYRCSSYNAKIGGAYGSRHTKGQACDFYISGVEPLKIAQYAESIGIKGIGLYDTFVHIDTRAAKTPAPPSESTPRPRSPLRLPVTPSISLYAKSRQPSERPWTAS